MSLTYKLRKISIDGDKKGYYYGSAIHGSVIDTEELSQKIQRNCSMKQSDVMAVLKEMEEVMHDSLCNGDIVKLDGIGSFKLSIKSSAVKSPADFGAKQVKRIKVNFQPERYKTSIVVETRADGTQVTKKIFTDTLTNGTVVTPDSSVAGVIKQYQDAQGN